MPFGTFIRPDRLGCHQQQRIFRAGRYASAASIAILTLDFGNRHITNARAKTYRVLIANIAAGLANDALLRKAFIRHLQCQSPRRLGVRAKDRFGAGVNTLTAESALTAPEIDFRVSGCTAYDDALRAGLDAFITGRAAFDEL
jgi:hypothetical protein